MPAEHVPITLLNGGAADAFSARCKALLAKAGFEPDDFGSYSHVNSRINAAKARVATAVAKGQTPSAHDQFLNDCTPGHLQQDGLFRPAGSRDDPCEVLVDGYDTRRAPTMPSRGDGDAVGTDEWRMGLHERNSIRNRGLDTGHTYPREQMDLDADDRLKHIERLNQRDTTAVQGGSGPQAANGANTGDASQANGAQGGSGNSSGGSGSGTLDGETAAECINAFRHAAHKEMLRQCIAEKPENEALVRRDAAAELATARASVEREEEALRNAQAAVPSEIRTELATAGGRIGGLPPDRRGPVARAVAPEREIEERLRQARAAETAARELPSRQATAQCRVNQANALLGLPHTTLRENGTVPAGWDIGDRT